MLLKLLKSDRFETAKSIIVYCQMKYTCDKVADDLSTNGFDAISYHTDKSPAERKRIQDLFMSNKLRIIVATVAFGMGLDKSDVNGVIHYNLPTSIENYVQEIGRAGRDGKIAFCHLFLSKDDYYRTRSLGYSDSVDHSVIKNLLTKIFTEPKEHVEDYYLGSISHEKIENELDIKREVVATVLSFLQWDKLIKLRDGRYFQIHSQIFAMTSKFTFTKRILSL